jgi:hypothetical protein
MSIENQLAAVIPDVREYSRTKAFAKASVPGPACRLLPVTALCLRFNGAFRQFSVDLLRQQRNSAHPPFCII